MFIIAGGTGWKEREPTWEVGIFKEDGLKVKGRPHSSSSSLTFSEIDNDWFFDMTTGLAADPAHNMVWIAADERIKAVSMEKKMPMVYSLFVGKSQIRVFLSGNRILSSLSYQSSSSGTGIETNLLQRIS